MGLTLAVLVAAGCGGSPQEPQAVQVAARTARRLTAREQIERTERRLLGARRLALRATVLAEGEVNAAFDGKVVRIDAAGIEVDFVGSLDGASYAPWLRSDEGGLRGGPRESESPSFVRARERELPTALFTGLTRSGLLPPLLQLCAGDAPAFAHGGSQGQIEMRNVTLGPVADRGGHTVETLLFDLVVRGEPAGQVTLWVDAGTALPVERSQVVRIAGGATRVTERYLDVRVDDEVADAELRSPRRSEVELPSR